MSTIAPRKIGFDSAGTRMTPEEFDAIDDWDECYTYELIDGVLVVSPIPSEAESDPNEELGHWLRHHAESHPQGTALDVTMSERYVVTSNRRRADRVIWAGLGRRPDPKVDPPTIVVEFVSAGKRGRHRDYVEKQAEYLGAGVVEYWVIDCFRRIMKVFQQGLTGPAEVLVAESETYRTDRLPGFELPLARLLAVADRWGSI